MSILLLGVKSVLEQRASQLCGQFLEEAVSLSFQIFIHSVLKESIYAEACHAQARLTQPSPSSIVERNDIGLSVLANPSWAFLAEAVLENF